MNNILVDNEKYMDIFLRFFTKTALSSWFFEPYTI